MQHFGKGALMAKTDIEEVFRLLPVQPDSLHLSDYAHGADFQLQASCGCRGCYGSASQRSFRF